MNKTLILVVEDDRPIRNLIVTTLKTHDYKYLAAENGSSAILEASSHHPDIVLLDLGLPDMEGVEVIKKIRTWSNMPIIVISARSEDSDKIEALDAGADDYITKPFNPLELLARVKSMMRRYTSLGSIAEKNNVIRIGDVELDKDAKEVRVNGKLVKMTATEYGILQLLMENAGKVFSIDEIYERVWNESSFSPENTVSVHIRRIREKIEINPKEPRYLKVVWGIGYKIEKI